MTTNVVVQTQARLLPWRVAPTDSGGRSAPRWRRLLAAMIVLTGSLLGAGSAVAAEPLRLALSKTPLTLPFFVAASEGFFAAEGVALKVEEVIGGHRSMQQVLDGQADLATSSDAVVMFTGFKRNDVAVIASFVSSPEDNKVVVRADSGIADPGQLKGRRVGTVWGASAHYYLNTLAALHGVDTGAMEIVRLQPEAMAGALADGSVDAVSVWQPFAYRAEQQVAGARVLDDGGFYVLRFNLVASSKVIESRQEDLVRVLRALARAQAFIAAEPARSQAILKARLQLDQAYIDWLWPRYRYDLTLDQSLLTLLESEARWALGEGLVTATKMPNYLRLVDSKALRRVRPTAVDIIE